MQRRPRKGQRRVDAEHAAGEDDDQAGDHADAQVDHAGGDDEGLADGEDAEDARLAKDVGEVGGIAERGNGERRGERCAAASRSQMPAVSEVQARGPGYSHDSAVLVSATQPNFIAKFFSVAA